MHTEKYHGPSGIKRSIGSRILRIGLTLGIVSVGGYEAYQHIPAVRESVDSLGANLAGRWNSLIKTIGPQNTEKFPTKLDQSSFTSVSKQEETTLWKNTKAVDPENYTLTIGFPVNQATINQSPNLKSGSLFDAKLPPYIDINTFIQKDVKNIQEITGLPKDTSIFFRFDPNKFDAGAFVINTAGVKYGEANGFIPAYTTVRVMLREKETGKSYGINLSGLRAKLLTDITPFPDKYSPAAETGTKIDPEKPILQLTTDLQDWDGKDIALPAGSGQVVINAFYDQENPRASIPFSIDFLHTAAGNIAVPEK